jgi:hypothetical protein
VTAAKGSAGNPATGPGAKAEQSSHGSLDKTSASELQVSTDQLAAQRFVTEAQRLANLGSDDRRFQIDKSAQRLGVPSISLEAAVREILLEEEKKGDEKGAGISSPLR